MVQQDKDLLLQDLCARLPYGVKGLRVYNNEEIVTLNGILPKCTSNLIEGAGIKFVELQFSNLDCCSIDKFKPYLRPLQSMTEEECLQFSRLKPSTCDAWKYLKTPVPLHIANLAQFDFFHSHHLDWRGLIEKELALDCTNHNIY